MLHSSFTNNCSSQSYRTDKDSKTKLSDDKNNDIKKTFSSKFEIEN